MGDYNPHVPQLLGLEWVPIRDELTVLSPDVNSVEYGHEFMLTSSRVVQTGRYYIHDMDAIDNDVTAMMISIYADEAVDEVGPIRRAVIPVEAVLVTGGVSTSSSRTGPQILLTPQFSDYYLLDATVAQSLLSMSFDMGPYTQDLTNKRILGVNVLLGGQRTVADGPVLTGLNTSQNFFGATNIFYDTGDAFTGPDDPFAVSRIALGAFCWHWQTPITSEFVPWGFADLARFDASSGSRLYIQVGCGTNVNGGFAGLAFLYYCALEVFYCEENRVAYGGLGHDPASGGGADSFKYGANIVTMRTPSTRAASPTLPAGRYTATIWSGVAGGTGPSSPVLPQLNAVRELYTIPPHPGVQVNIPFPLDLTAVGKTITSEPTHVLPQLSLHTSSGPLTEVHVYGRQAVAQVWGSITAVQEILDSPAGAATDWPQVRFYARRWGDTTVPLLLDSPDIGGSSVQITPTEFDALEEVNNGWKEITLRFDTPPSMGTGTNPRWRWSANGETAGNRWEVLGATAPAISGIGGNLFNLVPSPHQLSIATYGAPSVGNTINAQWVPQYAPPVSAISDDATTDMVLIFAQDMPAVSGFDVSIATQPVTGIGQSCNLDPCCIPTALLYHRLTWSLPFGVGVADDTFDRGATSPGWGTATDGKAWTTTDTATDFSTSGTEGLIVPSVLAGDRRIWMDVGGPDQDITFITRIDEAAESGSLISGALGRLTDSSNYYAAHIQYTSTGLAQLVLRRRVATVLTTIATVALPFFPSTTAYRAIRLQVDGSYLRAKAWAPDYQDEPWWQIVTTDINLTTGNNAGCYARDDTGAATTTFYYDNFTVRPPDFAFGYYEIQRSDSLTDWASIMQNPSTVVTGFNDYEARVGIETSYRIRMVDQYSFPGPWSDTVSITMDSPGASGGCIADGHVLLFSSNERQNGSVNLAYASVWEDTRVSEDFGFAEAGFVQLQPMYGADFFTAFRPTERGGEQFTRTVLVQAAAIAPETLGDFTSLRDMAWDSLSYVCVRDEDGNRWFATVLVPNGRVLRDRRLYLASVTIIEVTDTPSPVGVDPA